MLITQDQLDPKQREAVQLCTDFSLNTVGVTGPAGTGKTTIIKVVYDVFVSAGYTVTVATPTGKAAKRVREATGITRVKTIHKLLEYTMPGEIDENTGKPAIDAFPRRTKEKKLDEDVIIIDEMAMVSHELYLNLRNAMRQAAVLRCFGDVNQLSPIEESFNKNKASPFDEILSSRYFTAIRLETLHRHGEDAIIANNAKRILLGRPPSSAEGFTLRQCDISKIPATIVGVARTLVRREEPTFNRLDSQIIVPQNVSKIGTYNLNALLRDVYQDNDAEVIMCTRHEYVANKSKTLAIPVSVGDKVIITKNLYDLRPRMADRYVNEDLTDFIPPRPEDEVFNGETGIVLSIDDGFIAIDLGDRVVVIPPYLEFLNDKGTVVEMDPHKHIDHAYAITTHKSQGSEYQNVLYAIGASGQFMQGRRNYYTAITRARRAVMVIGDAKSLGVFSLRAKAPSEFK